LTKHILSERSKSQGSKFCDKIDIWTEMYSFVKAECIQLNSMEFNGNWWLFLVLRLNKISWELQFLWYQLQIWNITWLDLWL